MKAYQTKAFDRLARKAKVTEKELIEAVESIEKGLIYADLGSNLLKQRISQGEGGREGSQRAIIAFKAGERIVFLHMFAKRDQDNLTPKELKAYREAAKLLANVPADKVQKLLDTKEWIEIENAEEQEGVPE